MVNLIEDVHLVETQVLVLYLSYVFRELINSLVCWFLDSYKVLPFLSKHLSLGHVEKH